MAPSNRPRRVVFPSTASSSASLSASVPTERGPSNQSPTRGNRPSVVAKLDPLDSSQEPNGRTSALPNHNVRYWPLGACELNVLTTARLSSSGRPQRPFADRATQANEATTINAAANIENTWRNPKSLPATSRSKAASPAPMANDRPSTGSINSTSGGGNVGPMRASPIQANTQPTRAMAQP